MKRGIPMTTTETMISLEKKHINLSIGIAVTVILFLIGLTVTATAWATNIEATLQKHDDRITHVGEKVVDMRAEIGDLQDQADMRDIQLAEIKTKLVNIESLLVDIKQDLRDQN